MAEKPVADGESRVLVVDDNDDVRLSIAQVLQVGGYETVEAQDVEQALRSLAMGDIALVLLDFGVAVGKGFQLLREIEDLPPVIVMSASNDAPVVDPRVSSIFLPKPLPPSQLLEEVARQLNAG